MAFCSYCPTLRPALQHSGPSTSSCWRPVRQSRRFNPKRVWMADGTQSPSSEPAVELLSTVGAVEWLSSPVNVAGSVQRGLGRGSRKLGTPTANLPGSLLDDVQSMEQDGVYLGFGVVPSLGGSPVKMVANIGRNITFDDVPERVLEAYLMYDSPKEEFYGQEMRLCVVGYMRPEVKFDGIPQLIANIKNDVAVARELLDSPHATSLTSHDFLRS